MMKPVKVITYGRSAQNERSFPTDNMMARIHCQIILYDNMTYQIIDFGSANGTWVNGCRIPANVPQPLLPTDVVRIGMTTLHWLDDFFGDRHSTCSAPCAPPEPTGSCSSMPKPSKRNPIKILTKPFEIIANASSAVVKAIKDKNNRREKTGTTFSPAIKSIASSDDSNVYSSIYSPAEVKRKSHMLVQVYLHLVEESENVKALAQESQKNAERRDYIPLQCKLKMGDRVDVLLNIYGETLLKSDKKSVVWKGPFEKCSFDYFVPKDIDVEELSCVALLSVNGVPVGEMRFITKIVDAPRQLNPEIIAHKYSKAFISYSHQDESKVKFLHEGLELGSVSHFFDRKYLKAGDVFPQVIQDYINSADLFILCWSENAANSDYVEKERKQALDLAFPQVKPQEAAKLRIYPMSIEPRAELPSDMKENYHFGEI